MHIPWEVNSIGPGNHLNGTFRGIGIVAVKQDVPWRVEKVLIHQVCLVMLVGCQVILLQETDGASLL